MFLLLKSLYNLKIKRMGEKLTNAEKNYIIGKEFVENKDIIYLKQDFYTYIDGIWESITEQEVSSMISSEYILKFSPTTTSQIREVMRVISDITYKMYQNQIKALDKNEKESNKLNIKNGVIDLDTLEVREYEREDLAFYKLPFNYEPEKKFNCPTLMSFLTTSMNFDLEDSCEKTKTEYRIMMRFIQEWMGYTLIRGNRLHKSLIMTGDGRNGKGVLMHIWSRLVGQKNVSSVDLKGINSRQEIIMTKNKLINFAPDLEDGQQLDSGVVKSAIAGETVLANAKYKEPEEFEFSAKMIIACNELPYIKNIGSAVSERFYILPFDRVFSENERDPDLKKKLENELEDIFAWAVEGLKRLRERGFFIAPERCTFALNNYLDSHDIVKEWISEDDSIFESENYNMPRKQCYYYFHRYCKDVGRRPISNRKFYERLRKLGYKDSKTNGIFVIHGIQNKFPSD